MGYDVSSNSRNPKSVVFLKPERGKSVVLNGPAPYPQKVHELQPGILRRRRLRKVRGLPERNAPDAEFMKSYSVEGKLTSTARDIRTVQLNVSTRELPSGEDEAVISTVLVSDDIPDGDYILEFHCFVLTTMRCA